MDETVVVSPAWLDAHREDAGVSVVDVREPWEYDGIGHVPGAVNIPFDRIRDDSDVDPGQLPGADAFAAVLEAAGIERSDTIVAYDDTVGVFAARLLLTAHVYGHADVRLLDGDYSSWSRAYETTTDTQAVEPTSYDPEPLDPAASPLVDTETVADAVDGDALLVDTRDQAEFAEGHLPGANQFDWRAVVDDETRRLKPRAELEALFADHGITHDRELVLYCNTARRISHTYVVLQALGYDDVAFYEGSLDDWLAAGGDVDRDIEPGSTTPVEPTVDDD